MIHEEEKTEKRKGKTKNKKQNKLKNLQRYDNLSNVIYKDITKCT